MIPPSVDTLRPTTLPAIGRVRTQQSSADVIVEIDTSGSSDHLRVATFQNLNASELVADNWIFS